MKAIINEILPTRKNFMIEILHHLNSTRDIVTICFTRGESVFKSPMCILLQHLLKLLFLFQTSSYKSLNNLNLLNQPGHSSKELNSSPIGITELS